MSNTQLDNLHDELVFSFRLTADRKKLYVLQTPPCEVLERIDARRGVFKRENKTPIPDDTRSSYGHHLAIPLLGLAAFIGLSYLSRK